LSSESKESTKSSNFDFLDFFLIKLKSTSACSFFSFLTALKAYSSSSRESLFEGSSKSKFDLLCFLFLYTGASSTSILSSSFLHFLNLFIAALFYLLAILSNLFAAFFAAGDLALFI
jgi:hypothetical protein